MSIRSVHEEVPQPRPMRARAGGELKQPETLFGRAQRPAVGRGDRFERLARVVQRADVAELHRARLLLVEPAERKALRATDVRAFAIDPTRALGIEERAGA